MTLVLDSHVLHWWSAEPDRLSPSASQAISEADELTVAGISWFELAWMASHERIVLTVPISSWLQRLSGQVRTIGVTPAIALTAVSLPSTFPGDPADRLIYATAVERGWRLITKDKKLHRHKHPRPVILW
ncbi:MAG: type II toxin-antitoxin system VapC family toxin [Actinomycetota bacterium]